MFQEHLIFDGALTAFISMPGSTEWLIILVIGLLLFGRRLPEIMRSVGSSVHAFKQGLHEEPPTEPPDPSSS